RVLMRPDIWSGGMPVYCHAMAITGIRISGKMSVGVRSAANGPKISSSNAITTKVYGRCSAVRTTPTSKQRSPTPQRGPWQVHACSCPRGVVPPARAPRSRFAGAIGATRHQRVQIVADALHQPHELRPVAGGEPRERLAARPVRQRPDRL